MDTRLHPTATNARRFYQRANRGAKQELTNILGISSDGAVAPNGRVMSAAAKRKIAAAQKARWAKLRRVKPATRSVKPAAKKKTFSATTRAKLSAKLKAYWAKKKSGKK